MTTYIKESKRMIWTLLPVFLSLIVAGFVGLPLFQDGSSYLQEILIDHSAVRHGRVSILLLQYPAIFLIKTFHRREIDPLITLPVVRLAFNLTYALVPFVSLLLSWLVVRKKREELFIWAALIILLVNLVNFSWVSELLISVQFSCPLLLAFLQNPRSKAFWGLSFFILPFIFFLHPLVITIYLLFAAVSAYVAYRQPVHRRAARLGMILFLLAAAIRGGYSFYTLSLYEVSFAQSGEVSDYFTTTRWENILFLVTVVEIALLILLAQWMSRSKAFVKVVLLLVFLQSAVLLFFTGMFLLRGQYSAMALAGSIGVPVLLPLGYVRSTALQNTRWLYAAFAFLAVVVSIFLMAQYASDERIFTLKTGLSLLAALLIMMMAAIASEREHTTEERIWHLKFAWTLSLIFAGVMIIRSSMWEMSVQRLEQTLQQAKPVCSEIISPEFLWLKKGPYRIIDNWAVSTLALVVQEERPRKLLLGQGDCQLFYESGLVQIDPWSRFAAEFLVPPLE